MALNGEEPLTDDVTEGILTAIESNILIEKVMVEWLRDWFSSYSFQNTGEQFRKLFDAKIAGKYSKYRDKVLEVICKKDVFENFAKSTGKHLYQFFW